MGSPDSLGLVPKSNLTFQSSSSLRIAEKGLPVLDLKLSRGPRVFFSRSSWISVSESLRLPMVL